MRFELVHIVLGVLIGSLVGLGLYTFVYAKGYSYLSNDPKGCANCHVMEDNYSAWLTSSPVTEFVEAINTCRQGQLALRRNVKSVSVQFPSIPETQLGQRTQNGNQSQRIVRNARVPP